MDQKICRETRLTRSKDVLELEVVGDVIALDIKRGQCFGFNSTASVIWRALQHETSIAEICDLLLAEFEVEKGQCEAEVLRIVNEAHLGGLIKVINSGPSETGS